MRLLTASNADLNACFYIDDSVAWQLSGSDTINLGMRSISVQSHQQPTAAATLINIYLHHDINFFFYFTHPITNYQRGDWGASIREFHKRRLNFQCGGPSISIRLRLEFVNNQQDLTCLCCGKITNVPLFSANVLIPENY
jgi:hypothetical protein